MHLKSIGIGDVANAVNGGHPPSRRASHGAEAVDSQAGATEKRPKRRRRPGRRVRGVRGRPVAQMHALRGVRYRRTAPSGRRASLAPRALAPHESKRPEEIRSQRVSLSAVAQSINNFSSLLSRYASVLGA